MGRFGLVLDVTAVAVFVAIGRGAHADGMTLPGMVSTSWPFLAGLALGWVACRSLGRSTTSYPCGVAIVVTTVSVGMVFRVVAGQGTAFAFVLVALGFLGLAMLGWRTVARRLRQDAAPAAPDGPAPQVSR